MSGTRTIWKRRAALMAVVGLVVAVPVTIAVRGGGDSSAGPEVAGPALPELGGVKVDRDLGVALRLPEGWTRKQQQGAVTYRNGDRSVLIAVSAPGPARDADPIHDEAVSAIEGEYRKAKVLDRIRKQRLGGRPASAAVLAASVPEGDELRVLVATAKGRKRAYLVEVFASGSAGLVEAQSLLNTLRIKG